MSHRVDGLRGALHGARGVAHGAFDFDVPGVADHDDLEAFSLHSLDFLVDFGDERAGGVRDRQVTLGRGFSGSG